MLDGVLGRTLLTHGLPRAIKRVPGLKHLPVVKLLLIGELALVARRQLQHLEVNDAALCVALAP
jgi:hypothetical protein